MRNTIKPKIKIFFDFIITEKDKKIDYKYKKQIIK